jgi:2'-5' RNA ligase
MVRAFIAVNISDGHRQRLAELLDSFRSLDVGVKWVVPENLHVTLKFLGDTDEKVLDDLYAAVRNALAGLRRFQLSLRGLGQFPNARSPRVVWVGINDGADSLRQLSKRVSEAVIPFGFETEKRKFSAHLTIGRVKHTKNISTLVDKLTSMEFETEPAVVSEVIFYQSTLRPQGPIYTPLSKFELVE